MTPRLSITRDLGRTAGELVAMALDDAVGNKGRAVLAVPGGGSPRPVFRWLARHLDAHVHDRLAVTFVDERHLPGSVGVAPDQLPDESNLKGAWLDWFQHRPPPQVVPLIHGGTVHEAAAALTPAIEALGPPDVVLLGFGPDGHVASLFPGHPGLTETGPVVAISDSPKPPPERLTLSMPWLQLAYVTVAIGSGASKAAAAADVLASGELPLAQARPRSRWHLVLDPDAAPSSAGDPS